MSSPEFVYPRHPLYEPYRELAENTELVVAPDAYNHLRPARAVNYRRDQVPYTMAFSGDILGLVQAPLQERLATDTTTEFWHFQGGLNTLSHIKLWPDGFVNDGMRVAGLYAYDDHSSPQAVEMISYGVGTLRPFLIEGKGIMAALGWTARRIDSTLTRRGTSYLVDIQVSSSDGWKSSSYALESTNVVMPEVVGELHQLAARRDDRSFLEAYTQDLQLVMQPVPPVFNDGMPAPSRIRDLKRLWQAAHLAHLGSGLWDQPPASAAELLGRVDRLLDAIVTDESPVVRSRNLALSH